MKTAKKSNPQPFFSPKSRKWRKKSIARQHLHVPRSCRRRLAILQQLSLKQNDLEWPPLLPGCGTQHPLRALGGTRVLLAAAPTTPPCFRRWRRSSSLHFGHKERKEYFYSSSETPAGVPELLFYGRDCGGKPLRRTFVCNPFFASQKGAQGLFWGFSGRFDAFQGPFTQNCSTFAAVRGILQTQSSALFNMPFP